MNLRIQTRPVCRLLASGLVAAAAVTLPARAAAQIPQPGMVLYGTVTSNGQPVTTGVLTWTLTPATGDPFDIEVSLQPLQSPAGESLSYTAMIPASVDVSGFPPTTRGLRFSSGRLQIDRRASIDGEFLQIDESRFGASFSVSAEQALGLVERVDLVVPSPRDCCLGDADLSGAVTLLDYRAVRDHFGDASPALGDANCDSFVNIQDYIAVRDRFGESCDGAGVLLASSLQPQTLALAGAELRVVAPVETIAPGAGLTVEILADSAADGLLAAGVYVAYDPGLLEFEGGSANSSMFDDPLLTGTPREIAPGLIAFSAGAGAGLPALEGATVASLRFRAVTVGEAVLSLQTAAGDSGFLDTGMNLVSTSLEGDTVTIETGGRQNDPKAIRTQFMIY